MEEIDEAASGENITLTDSPSKSKQGQTRRAPNRQKFEADLNEIKQQIEAKEQELQTLLGNGPQSRLQQLREKREAANQRRKNINAQLEALNQQINIKRDASSQLRSKLQYQTEAQVDQVVRRLEVQLQNHSFRLAEERRLVAEIDKLRRSKKCVKQYNDAKDELNKLRDSQQQLRADRDVMSREMLSLRGEEDAVHSDVRKNRELADVVKKELDELHERKRSRVLQFKTEQNLYAQQREQRRPPRHEKLTQVRSQDRETVTVEPYLEERQLCKTLLSFLSKLDSTPASTPASAACTPSSAACTPLSAACTPMSPDAGDMLFAGIPRKNSRKVKRSLSRASINKKRLVALTPDLLSQFATLQVTAPSCHAEVPALIETLKAKQKLFSRLAAAASASDSAAMSSSNLLTSDSAVEANSTTAVLTSEITSMSNESAASTLLIGDRAASTFDSAVVISTNDSEASTSDNAALTSSLLIGDSTASVSESASEMSTAEASTSDNAAVMLTNDNAALLSASTSLNDVVQTSLTSDSAAAKVENVSQRSIKPPDSLNVTSHTSLLNGTLK